MTINMLWLVVFCVLTYGQTLHGLRIPLSEKFDSEKVRVDLTDVTDDFSPFGRHKRGADYVPDSTQVKLHVNGDHVTLDLQRNRHLDVNMPVYTSSNGRVQQRQLESIEGSAIYQDFTNGASLLLQGLHQDGDLDHVTIFGSFYIRSQHYVIQPNNDSRGGADNERHVVSRVPEQTIHFEGGRSVPGATTPFGEVKSMERQIHHLRRRQTDLYKIELYMVTDYAIYKFWYDMTSGNNRNSDTMQFIRQYYLYMVSEVDTRYKSISGTNFVIDVLSAGLYISENPGDSPWAPTTSSTATSTNREQLDSDSALKAFMAWIGQQSGIPGNDHAMAFTGQNLVNTGAVGDSSGLAYTPSLCTDNSVSIVEESFTFITMTTAAHELGHSLSAKHDGAGNACSSSNNYIMAVVNSINPSITIGQNLWRFSSCTGPAMATYINRLNSLNNNCMLSESSTSSVANPFQPQAEVYPADDVCVYNMGAGSYVCRSIQDYNGLCVSMFCSKPGTTTCFNVLPAEGTPCGQGKWCERGVCVASADAPNNNADNCPLGDRPGLFDNTNLTCSQYVAQSKSRCYNAYVNESCCASCNAVRNADKIGCEYGDSSTQCGLTGVCYNYLDTCCESCANIRNDSILDCIYGDKLFGCMKDSCPFYDDPTRLNCCETCLDPTKLVSTTTTTTPKTTTTKAVPITTTTTTTKGTTTTRQSVTTQPTAITTSKTTALSTASTTLPANTTASAVSDTLLIGVGVGAGALVIIVIIIVVVVIKCRKSSQSGSKPAPGPAKDNTYDNIGFVTQEQAIKMPQHPPPRWPSNTSLQQPVQHPIQIPSAPPQHPPPQRASNSSLQQPHHAPLQQQPSNPPQHPPPRRINNTSFQQPLLNHVGNTNSNTNQSNAHVSVAMQPPKAPMKPMKPNQFNQQNGTTTAQNGLNHQNGGQPMSFGQWNQAKNQNVQQNGTQFQLQNKQNGNEQISTITASNDGTGLQN